MWYEIKVMANMGNLIIKFFEKGKFKEVYLLKKQNRFFPWLFYWLMTSGSGGEK